MYRVSGLANVITYNKRKKQILSEKQEIKNVENHKIKHKVKQ